jgi:hypothetical protein
MIDAMKGELKEEVEEEKEQYDQDAFMDHRYLELS